ncbi:protein-glutamate O-methyltransferase CheR [Vibrio sp. S9_S30]|uniref:CheR family methyltransferase n=1 Tax=Vibrio sp. S9_S30 TaxID=2720226 RepID=UPI001680B066|nr:protein-glutamate O-methyltransferase CheR [Vibrio sp. S9_S30]MBD1558115.1 protein-glutamate O-methyltransferase CheR [Vibrio sp. S9_S30]
MGRILSQTEAESPLVGREFELTEQDFKYIQYFVHKSVGIFLSDKKKAMVYGRISRILREHGFQRFTEYRELLETSDAERVNFINNLTTNKTHFFREFHHFEYLEQVMIPKWFNENKKQLRFWSAGCSTGEEPYSYLAMLKKAHVFERIIDVRMLATDLDTNVLARAKQGIYSEEVLTSIPSEYLKGAFVKGKGQMTGKIKIKRQLQQYLTFNQLNLLADWPMDQQFDVISCRNVMIYFDKTTQETLIRRFYKHLADDGVLLIGHSESVGNCTDIFRHLGHTIYVKQ